MAKVIKEQLINEYGTAYGWEVDVYPEAGDTQADVEDAVCTEFGLDAESDSDIQYIYHGGTSVWDQFHMRVHWRQK